MKSCDKPCGVDWHCRLEPGHEGECVPWGDRISKPVMRLVYADQPRSEASQKYIACPVCKIGWMGVYRDLERSFVLRRNSNCIRCGQRVYFIDRTIDGEAFPTPAEGLS